MSSSKDSWADLQRCLERIREGVDAPLVPVIGSGLHIWAGLPKQSPVTDWYELLRQVNQRLKLEHFPMEALKDFLTLAWDSMMVAAARNSGKAAHQFEAVARKRVRQVIEEYAADRIPSEIRDRYQSFARLPWQHVISLNFDALWIKCGLGDSVARLCRPSASSKQRIALRYRVTCKDDQRSMTVWYPHGALGLPGSICLGLRDYGGLMPQANAAFVHYKAWEQQQLPGNLAVHGLSPQEWRPVREKLQSLLLSDQSDPPVSSVSLILTHPLIFLGCGLSPSEWGLWWVLNQRQRNLARVGHREPSVFALMNSESRNEFWNSRPAGVVPLWCDKWDVGWQRVFDLTS